ncbi:MAG: MFS transporter [bacterium]|nr:MFS transporter [bacterium]
MAERDPRLGAPTPSRTDSAYESDRRGLFPAYLGTISSWFGGWGMQQVLFPWLVVGVLQTSAENTGIAQMSVLISNLAFLLVGGAVADRFDPRRLLILTHLAGVLPVGLLLAAVTGGWLSLPVLVLCGLGVGMSSAFSNPARDSLLSDVAGADLERAVTGVTAVQFGSQTIGMSIVGLARWIGTEATLVTQAVVLAAGSLFARRLPGRPPQKRDDDRRLSVSGMTEGVRFVWSSELRPVFILIAGVGLFFMGSYHVVFPHLVHGHYQGNVQQLSLLMMMFPIGTIAGSLVLLKRGGIRRKGRALMLALGTGGLCLITAGLSLPFWGAVLATLDWGLCGAVFMNMSRTLFQERAVGPARARVLAVNQLGFLGAAPVGSLLAGYTTASLGPSGSLIVLGSAMLVLVGSVAAFSDAIHME